MNDFEELALDLCEEYGLNLTYAREAVERIMFEDVPEKEALDELHDRYGDAIYE